MTLILAVDVFGVLTSWGQVAAALSAIGLCLALAGRVLWKVYQGIKNIEATLKSATEIKALTVKVDAVQKVIGQNGKETVFEHFARIDTHLKKQDAVLEERSVLFNRQEMSIAAVAKAIDDVKLQATLHATAAMAVAAKRK